MLIRNAQIGDGLLRDLRIVGTRIGDVEPRLQARGGEPVIDARGGFLLPGLHDHHLHLQAAAAAMQSISCGPPQVIDEAGLRDSLTTAAGEAPTGWLRGTGYHESVAGSIDREFLDSIVGARPLRVQHRSGRLWIFNSAGLAQLEAPEAQADDPLERIAGRLSGRLYDGDGWLRTRIPGTRPNLRALSRQLARHGITGLADTSHDNDAAQFERFAQAQSRGELLQTLLVMGDASLDGDAPPVSRRISGGALKIHLHDHDLPDFGGLCDAIRRSHAAQRPVAFHCVTRGELVFALAALDECDSLAGDRIEHAGIVPPECLAAMRARGVCVVTQPHFIAERGDAYLREVEPAERPNLYRLRSLRDAGIPLAAGSDAPYGNANPWCAMQAAVTRRTRGGAVLGSDEALSPEQALNLFLGPLARPGAAPRRIEVGAAADLCLLALPWNEVRNQLDLVAPRLTLIDGQRVGGADPGDPI